MAHFDQRIIDGAVIRWRQRLYSCTVKMEDILNLKFKRSVWLDYSKVCCTVELTDALI